MPFVYKGHLRSVLPAPGMKYESTYRVMHSHHREKRIVEALKATGYDITCAVITQVLVNMFRIATPIVTEGHAKGEDLWDLLPRLQTQLDWTQNLPQSIFFEFFVCLIEARHGWERTPTYPYYDYEKYGPAVRELVSFRESIGDYGANNVSWVLNDGVFFNELAGGFTVDEGEGEDVVMSDPNLDAEDCHDHSEDPTIADVALPLAQMNIEQK